MNSLKARFQQLLTLFLGVSWQTIEPMLPIFRARAGEILAAGIPIALEYVVRASLQESWSGTQRKNFVKSAVGNVLLSQGLALSGELSSSLLDTISQNAYTLAKIEKQVL